MFKYENENKSGVMIYKMASYENHIQTTNPAEHRYFCTLDGFPIVYLDNIKVSSDEYWYTNVFVPYQLNITLKPTCKLILVNPCTTNMAAFEIEIFQGIISIQQFMGSSIYLDQVIKTVYLELIRATTTTILNELTLKFFYYSKEEYNNNDFIFTRKTNTTIFGYQCSEEKYESKRINGFNNNISYTINPSKIESFMDLTTTYIKQLMNGSTSTPDHSSTPNPFVTTTSTPNAFSSTSSTPNAFSSTSSTPNPFVSTSSTPNAFSSTNSTPNSFSSTSATLNPFGSTSSTNAFGSTNSLNAFGSTSSFGSGFGSFNNSFGTTLGSSTLGTSPKSSSSSVFGSTYFSK